MEAEQVGPGPSGQILQILKQCMPVRGMSLSLPLQSTLCHKLVPLSPAYLSCCTWHIKNHPFHFRQLAVVELKGPAWCRHKAGNELCPCLVAQDDKQESKMRGCFAEVLEKEVGYILCTCAEPSIGDIPLLQACRNTALRAIFLAPSARGCCAQIVATLQAGYTLACWPNN